jgi:hypothetical protein
MTASFDCPDCGAPLDFDPEPGQETVECSFCHQTVIIPEDLRIPLPEPVVETHLPEKPKPRSQLVTIFAWIGVVMVILLIIGLLAPSDESSTTPTDAATYAVSGPTATAEAQATLDALQPVLAKEQSWPVIFLDPFMDNNNHWQTGDVRDKYVTGNRSIGDGFYTWNVTAVQGTSDFSFPDLSDQTDFFASVDIKLNSMPDDPDADAGMALRYNSGDQSWYYFSVNDKGQYYFGWYDGTDWYNLIPETDSAAIHPGGTNRLAVGVRGAQFIFLINGQVVDHFIDESQKSGGIGVGINLPNMGEKGNVSFSNFQVSAVSANP